MGASKHVDLFMHGHGDVRQIHLHSGGLAETGELASDTDGVHLDLVHQPANEGGRLTGKDEPLAPAGPVNVAALEAPRLRPVAKARTHLVPVQRYGAQAMGSSVWARP